MRKRTGYIFISGIVAIMIVAVAAVAYLKKQTHEISQQLEQVQQEKTGLNEVISHLHAQSRADSLLVNGNYDKALHIYEQHYNDADSTTRRLIASRMEVARQMQQFQQKINVGVQDYSHQIQKQQDSLGALGDSLQTITRINDREHDSLLRMLQLSWRQLENLQRQLQEVTREEFLTFNSSKGNKVFYIGELKDGKANGHGVGIWLTGSKYEGQWKDNKRHGEGEFVWADGQRYEGEFRNDMREGEGTYYWPNGEKYVGEWKQDKRSGQGTFYNSKGEVLAKGIWKDDRMVEVNSKS